MAYMTTLRDHNFKSKWPLLLNERCPRFQRPEDVFGSGQYSFKVFKVNTSVILRSARN